MKLYSGPLSMFGAKAEIAVREKALDFELVMVPFDPVRGYDPKHPEVRRINPKSQVPVLVDGEPAREVEIFDSTQIFEYLEDRYPVPPLWPNDPAARARARLLELRSDEVYVPHVIRLMALEDTPEEPGIKTARDAAARYYQEMDALLADGRDFLAGPYTFADIAFYMAQLFGARKGAPMTSDTPKLIAWRDRMSARPPVRIVAGAMGRYLAAIGRPVPEFMQALI